MKRTLLAILLILALLAGCTGLAYAGMKAPEAGDDTFPVWYNGSRTGYVGYYYRGNVYLTLQTLEKYGDCSRIAIDTDSRRITFNIADFTFVTADEELSAFIAEHGGTGYIRIASWNANVKYIVSADAIGKLVKLSAELDLKNKRILLSDYDLTADEYATVTRDVTFVPTLATFTTDARVLPKGTSVIYEGETAHYTKVRTSAGFSGYVLKSTVERTEADLTGADAYFPKKAAKTYKTPFNAVWVYCQEDVSTQEIPDKHAGIDILEPVWVRMEVEQDGLCHNDCDAGFVKMAHANGYEVWGTVSNNFTATGSSNFTYVMLTDEAIMDTVIAQYLFYAILYDWDGINVDYEQIEPHNPTATQTIETRDGFLKLLEKLTDYAHRQGLPVSCDVPPVKDWYPEFDFKRIGEICDFTMVMTYDQHYSGSANAGSVSDLPWEEDCIKTMLRYVPAEKLVICVPTYMRLYTTPKTGLTNLSNGAVSMTGLAQLLKKYELTPAWRDYEKQYYAEWTDPNDETQLKRLWIEDSRSTAYRLDLTKRFALAGTAVWSYDNGNDDIWDVYDAMLHKGEPLEAFDVELYADAPEEANAD
ncbi:MAG: hypothetical protein IKX91_01075 [Firmicutes bacterium]|nr:hypothetical protein [Bacillota bacterium]